MFIHISAYINVALHFQIHTHIFPYTHVLVNIYSKSKLFPYKASEDSLLSLANFLLRDLQEEEGLQRESFLRSLKQIMNR